MPSLRLWNFEIISLQLGHKVIQQYSLCDYLATQFLISENFIQIQIPRTKHLEDSK